MRHKNMAFRKKDLLIIDNLICLGLIRWFFALKKRLHAQQHIKNIKDYKRISSAK